MPSVTKGNLMLVLLDNVANCSNKKRVNNDIGKNYNPIKCIENMNMFLHRS